MKTTSVMAMIVLPALLGGCAPVLEEVAPYQGYPGQIVALYGERLEGATVRWGSSGETVLQSHGSARYFQIPRDAALGKYEITVENTFGTSNSVSFGVKVPSGEWPAPRIEDITIHSFKPLSDGSADILLAIPVANVDPDAKVFVCENQKKVETVFYSAIASGYLNEHDPAAFGYPIYHYGLLLAHLDHQPLGVKLEVQVVNADDQPAVRKYTLPSSGDRLDSDHDGLLDSWEVSGYSYKGKSGSAVEEIIDLAGMGCDPHRKDILVEVDWIAAAEPPVDSWADIRSVFAKAPVLNPDGSAGISLHIDYGQGDPFASGGEILEDHCTTDFCTSDDPEHTDFYSYKRDHFAPARRGLFHYGIIGRELFWGASGNSTIIDDDFIVTLNDAITGEDPTTRSAFVGTFVHELGHNLGLHHGGIHYDIVEGAYSPATLTDGSGVEVNLDISAANASDEVDPEETHKPNQSSSMNYRYQLRGASIDLNMVPERVQTYSQGMLRPVGEGGTTLPGILADKNKDGDRVDLHHDYDEWGNLHLNFRTNQSWGTDDTSDCCSGTINVDSVSFIRDSLGNPAFCDSIVIVVETLDGSTIGTSGCPKGTNTCGYGEVSDIPCGSYRVYVACGTNRFYWKEKNGNPLLADTLDFTDSDTTGADILAIGPSSLFEINLIVVMIQGSDSPPPPVSSCPATSGSPEAFSDIKPAPSNEVFNFARMGTGPGIDVPACSTPDAKASDMSLIESMEPTSFGGTFFSKSLEEIRFVTETGAHVDFTLPKDLLSAPIDSTKGTVEILDRSSAAGADKMYTISTSNGLYLMFVWKSGGSPVQFKRMGVNVEQPMYAGGEHRGLKTVGFKLGSQEIPPRQSTKVRIGNHDYLAFSRSSLYRTPLRGRDAKLSSYVLRAIVLRESRPSR